MGMACLTWRVVILFFVCAGDCVSTNLYRIQALHAQDAANPAPTNRLITSTRTVPGISVAMATRSLTIPPPAEKEGGLHRAICSEKSRI